MRLGSLKTLPLWGWGWSWVVVLSRRKWLAWPVAQMHFLTRSPMTAPDLLFLHGSYSICSSNGTLLVYPCLSSSSVFIALLFWGFWIVTAFINLVLPSISLLVSQNYFRKQYVNKSISLLFLGFKVRGEVMHVYLYSLSWSNFLKPFFWEGFFW